MKPIDRLNIRAARVARHLQETQNWDRNHQVLDEVSKQLQLGIASATQPIPKAGTAQAKARVLDLLDRIIVATYLMEESLPSIEDVADSVSHIHDTVHNDAVLASSLITRGLCDALLHIYSKDGKFTRKVGTAIGEALCGVHLLAIRLKVPLSELLVHET